MKMLRGLALRLHLPWRRAQPDWNHSLPVEILEKILGYLLAERDASATRVSFIRETCQPTLRAAALVCRVWYGVVMKHLYKEIYVSSSMALSTLADALKRNEDLRPLVHQFYFTSKIYKTGVPECFSAMDMYNEMRIHELCPNLHRFVDEIPFPGNKADIRILYRGSSFWNSITYLKIAVPSSTIFGEMAAGWSWHDFEFEGLQTLYVSCSHHDMDLSRITEARWFRMPQLRRLVLQGFVLTISQKLTFPMHSPLLNTIELLQGNYVFAEGFFNPPKSPLLPYRKTLECLVITANYIGRRHDYWNLGFLESLVELCVPIRSFTRLSGTIVYPPRLKELVLTGFAGNSYVEEFEEPRWIGDVSLARWKLDETLTSWSQKSILPELKRIRVLVRDVEKDCMFPWTIKKYPGIEVILGLGREKRRQH